MQEITLTQNTFTLFPTVYAVQNDTGRELKMTIQDQTLLLGDTGAVAVQRSDGSYYTIAATLNVLDNAFTADISQALTQPGRTLCQLKVTRSDLVVSSYTFAIMVQPSTDGVPAEQLGISVQDLMDAAAQIMYADTDTKAALLQIASKLAYIDANGQTYYDALFNALYPPIRATSVTLNKNSLVFGSSGVTETLTATVLPNNHEDTVVWGTSDPSVAVVSDGIVTSVGVGTCTITATCGPVHKNANVTVSAASLVSISAVYTQSGTVYDTDTLDSLKADLVVTATWSDSTTTTVPASDYSLSGTLEEGTSTITVEYGDQSDTFTVTVTHDDRALYPLTDYTSDIAIVENGYQYTWIYTGGTSYNKFYGNINDGKTSTTTSGAQLDNKAKWFTLHAGDEVTITLSNIVNAKNKSFAFMLRKANTTQNLADVAISNGVHTGSVTATGTITADVDISKVFIYEQSGSISANTSISFDISLTVNGLRYI